MTRPIARGALGSWLVRVVVIGLCALWVVPTVGTVVTSFRTADDAQSTGWWHVLTDPGTFTRLTLDNYRQVLTGPDAFGTAFVNSVAISLPATLLPILVATFAAYAFTFLRWRGRELLFVVTVSLLVVPNQVAFLPLLRLYAGLGLQGSLASVWLAHAGFALPLAIFILRNYMTTLPRDVVESARVDGASHFQILWRLVIPMSAPALASFAVFQFLWVWNDLLVALIFLGSGDKAPLPVALAGLLGEQNQGWQAVTAGGVLMMVVPVAVFVALQRYFVRGLTAGAVKQ
ncbi:MAG: carbohydrate ABC transporter permease [Jatrophihabitans sp.]|uniref:carbohydrate ABC transporter permease n=1 Tax=Jatrophihabitans sp. TaxID=1932789 RepID=UPI00390FDB0B